MRLLLVFAALAAALVPLASAQEPATLMTPVVADAISDLRAAHFAHAARAVVYSVITAPAPTGVTAIGPVLGGREPSPARARR